MTTANSSYRPEIDGLRAVAVIAVVLNHLSASLLPGGYVGVDVFFVISGYLITGIITREIEQGTFTFAQFYERRVRRIFPALFAMMAVTLVAGYALLLPSDYLSTLRGALGTLFFSSNIVFWRDMAEGYFAATDASLNPLLHTWSLAVEEQFYVFFPIVLLVFLQRGRRFIIPLLLIGVLVSLLGAALLINSKSVAVFFLLPFRAWELLAGSLLALGAVPQLRTRAPREVTAGAGLLAILFAYFAYDSKTTFPGLAALAPVLGTVAIIHASSGGGNFVASLLRWRPLVFIGLISYSLYLWHWPLIVFVRYSMGMEPLGILALTGLFLGSLVLAYLSYRFIEQPLRRPGQITRSMAFISAAVVTGVLAAVSGVGVFKDGFESRFSPEVVALDKARAPVIPFKNCDVNLEGDWCLLGGARDNAATAPATLLWGDSHMLAWAPALDVVFKERKETALLAYTSTCPPMIGISSNKSSLGCPERNASIKAFLQKHPEIKTVVMAAYWSIYFRNDGPLAIGNLSGTAAAERGLEDTLLWLSSQGMKVVLIGPVPVYEKSVPLSLAFEKETGRKLIYTTQEDQYQKNASFYRVASATRPESSHVFLDPIQWLCSGPCSTSSDNELLYRDNNHLSVAGAMTLKPQLAAGIPVESQVSRKYSQQ